MQAAAWYSALRSAAITSGRPPSASAQVRRQLVAGDDEIASGAQAHRSDDRVGEGQERMERRDSLVRRQHLQAERARAVRNNGGGHGPDGRSDGGDGPVGNRQQQHVDTVGGRGDVVAVPEKPEDLDADGFEGTDEGAPGAPGPDDANRCHGELVSFRPSCEVPFVSQRLPERTNHSHVERHGVRLGEALAPVRRDAGRVEVLERSKHEAALGHPRMGHDEVRLGDLEIPDEQDVDVQCARAVADGADPARRLLDTPGNLEQWRALAWVSSRTTQFRYRSWDCGPPRGAVS